MSSPAYYLGTLSHFSTTPSQLTLPRPGAVLVGTVDNPLYETTLASSKSGATAPPPSASSPATPTSFSIFGALPAAGTGARAEVGYTGGKGEAVMQLIAHASLDVVEDVMWTNGGM